MNSQLSSLLSELLKVLGFKLIGLLHIGSNERKDETAFSDVDLILLSEELEIRDLQAVREIIRNLTFLVDMPIIQKDQVPENPDLFQMGTHGCYFIAVLKKAQTLYGVNFFWDYPDPSTDALRASIFRKIAEYTWASRRMYIESNRERSAFQNYQYSSRVLKSVKDVLWLCGIPSAHSFVAIDSVGLLKEQDNSLLTLEEWNTLESIANPNLRNQLAANMSEDFLLNRVSILEKLHSYAVKIFNGPY